MIPPRKLQITCATTLVTNSAPGWCLEADAAAVQEVASGAHAVCMPWLDLTQPAACTNITGPKLNFQITRPALVANSAPASREVDAAAAFELTSGTHTPCMPSLDLTQPAACTNITGPKLNLQITHRALVANSAPGSPFQPDSEPASEEVCATRPFARRYSTRGVHQRRHSDTRAVIKQ